MSDAGHRDIVSPVVIGAEPLTIPEIVAVARNFAPVELADEARRRIALSRAVVDTLTDRNVKVYGITTGFASLRDRRIEPSQAGQLSENLIRSHATGVGEPFSEDVVRAALLVRANALAKGYSGVRVVFVEKLLELLNKRIYPFVPEQGSVGSSGDLAPLSHLFLAVIGDPEARVHRVCFSDENIARTKTFDSVRRNDFVSLRELDDQVLTYDPIKLEAKEGLAANNGAVFAAVVSALATHDAETIISSAELISALSFEALQAVPDCLEPAITASRPHEGHRTSAANIRSALRNSELIPENGAGGLNIARYNRAIMTLHEIITTLKRSDKSKQSVELLQNIRDLMISKETALAATIADERSKLAATCEGSGECRPLKEAELQACKSAFSEILKEWESALGWRDSNAAPLTPAASKALSALYHEQIEKIVRPDTDPDVQDNYSFRATPTVLGAARDALAHCQATLETEINSATDNPLILIETLLEACGAGSALPEIAEFRAWLSDNWTVAADNVKSAANFHGEPVGLVAEYLSQALAEVGNISERRLAVLMDKDHSKGMPSYLVWEPGLNSGLMLTQYTAASLVTENKTLCAPAVVDSIPTGESCEDHNSMATHSARKLRAIARNTQTLLAIEALGAYQGIQFRKPFSLGETTAKLEALIESHLRDPLIQLGSYDSLEQMRKRLGELGVSECAANSIRASVIDDITLYPLIDELTALVTSGAIAKLSTP